MIKTEQKEIVRKYYNQVPVSGVCDVCGSELKPIDESKCPPLYKDKDIYDYYRITTYHHDWGNDSIDSYKYTDCCCLDCAMKFIHKYWDGCTRKSPWPTKEMEMKHEYELTAHD